MRAFIAVSLAAAMLLPYSVQAEEDVYGKKV